VVCGVIRYLHVVPNTLYLSFSPVKITINPE
jgi:hypothetical protein